MCRLSFRAFGIIALLTSSAFSQEAPVPLAAATPNAAGTTTMELNKLEQVDNACRAYMVVDSRSQQPLNDLTVEVYLFDEAGVILRGLALQFADVQPGRANVVPFELPDLACTDIKRILLNKVLTCTTTDDVAVEGCSDALTVNSRVDVPFDY